MAMVSITKKGQGGPSFDQHDYQTRKMSIS